MRIVMFYHSLVSDWNHGNAHFLRGIASELLARGHSVQILEPRNSWSREHLIQEHGARAVNAFHQHYPELQSHQYDLDTFDLDSELDGADLVLVHEWNDPGLVASIGCHHRLSGGYHLLFHDTHHRSITEPEKMAAYELDGYDGVLAFGEVIRQRYLDLGWADRAWTWHEAADVKVFRPLQTSRHGDLIWIGNWGDEERSSELEEFLISPVEALGLEARIHGVRYPPAALQRLSQAGIDYAGWLPNFDVPRVFAGYRLTLHIPRRPYVEALPGIPTIRVFEALACGIPLICAPWNDTESLFTPGEDYLVGYDGAEMKQHIRAVMSDSGMAQQLADHGRKTILARHTCAHRVDELLAIVAELNADVRPELQVEVGHE